MKISAPDEVAGWLCGLPPQTQQRVRLALGGWADGKGDIKSAFPLTKPEPPVGDWEIVPPWGYYHFRFHSLAARDHLFGRLNRSITAGDSLA